MKKFLVVLLMVTIAIGTVFASVSIDARVVGIGAAYGLSYESDQVRVGVDVSTISPAYALYELIRSADINEFHEYFDPYVPYLYIPSGFSLYLEYDLIPAKVVDITMGLGLTYVLPVGVKRLFSVSRVSALNLCLDFGLAINFSEHHGITSRIVCPLTTTLHGEDANPQYFGPYGAIFLSSFGYRFTF